MKTYNSISTALLEPLNVYKLEITSGRKNTYPIPWHEEPYSNNSRISELVQLEELTIRGYKFDSFDFDFAKLPLLKKFDIGFNDFGYWLYMPREENGIAREGSNHVPYIAANFYALTNLEHFDFSGNQLGYIEFPKGSFPNLETLILSSNARENVLINRYDEEICILNLPHFPQLKTIDLHDNQFTAFPPIFHLTTLEKVILHSNKISHISDDIAQLSALKTLALSYNELEAIPQNLNNSNLEALFLSHNKIWWVDGEIERYTHLKTLDLRNNNLEEISVHLLKLRNLEQLYLGHNKLTELPAKLHQLKKLKKLDLTGNAISPQSIQAFRNKRPDVEVTTQAPPFSVYDI